MIDVAIDTKLLFQSCTQGLKFRSWAFVSTSINMSQCFDKQLNMRINLRSKVILHDGKKFADKSNKTP